MVMMRWRCRGKAAAAHGIDAVDWASREGQRGEQQWVQEGSPAKLGSAVRRRRLREQMPARIELVSMGSRRGQQRRICDLRFDGES